MTGFVDPAFRHLKPTEPGFLVWRISKKAEDDYEAKPIRKEFFGLFYQEDSYIIYSSSPIKKPLWSYSKGPMLKMEIHIHFWLGSKITQDECRRTILKAVELDDVLEGAAVLHREVQGQESNRFLSYFKKGMIIELGEIAHVLRQSFVEMRPKLYEVSERASTWIMAEKPSISWSFINSQQVFVLETTSKFFIWVGKKTGRNEKFLALKVGKQLARNSRKKEVIWVMEDNEGELAQQDLKEFEEHLSLKSKSMKSTCAEEDLVLAQTKTRKITMLYKVVSGETDNTILHMKDGPLDQSDLNAMGMCIVDHYRNGVWVWVSKKVPEEERFRAINFGVAYLEKKQKSDPFDMSKTTVTRVVEGNEPADFKLLFRSWSDTFPSDGHHYFSKKPARPVNATFTAERLEDSVFLAAETQLLDYGSGKMSILRVTGDKLEPLRPEEFGIFQSNFSYLVHYCYTVTGQIRTILYYWLGCDVPAREKDRSIWPSLKDIPELNSAEVQVRIEQYSETPHFYAMFQGKIIVLTSQIRPHPESKHVLDLFPVLLLKVTGGDMLNTVSVEVEPRASSLNSYNVFILRTPTVSFVWYGLSSKGDEREIANHIAGKWTSGFTVILEGHENEDFWRLLGGYKPYFSEEKFEEAEVNVPARAFKCSVTDTDFRASEIINYDQSDVNSHDIVILDTWKIIFVWIGRDVLQEDKFNCEKLAEAYLNSDPSYRTLGIPIVQVHQDFEPALFRGFFTSWGRSWKLSYEDLVKSKLFAEVKVTTATEEVKVTTGKEAVKNKGNLIHIDHSKELQTSAAQEIYPVHLLQEKSIEELPPGVDPLRKEAHISDEEFIQVFGMPRSLFSKLPQWKRRNLKISVGLF